MVRKTTLSVDKDFAEAIRNNYEGSNDMERLHEWAEQYESEEVLDEQRIRQIARDVIDEEKTRY